MCVSEIHLKITIENNVIELALKEEDNSRILHNHIHVGATSSTVFARIHPQVRKLTKIIVL